MSIFHDEKSFAVLLPAKCGSSNLKHLMFRIENGREFTTFTANGFTHTIHSTYRSPNFKKMGNRLEGKDNIFAVVRDPHARILSCWANRVMGLKKLKQVKFTQADRDAGLSEFPSYEVFIANLDRYLILSPDIAGHAAPLMHFLGHDPSIYTKIYSIKQMRELADRMCEIMGSPPLELTRPNSTKHVTYPDEISQETKDIISEHYAEEIALYAPYY
ncbi:sulfotransferase family 2 domain-containing protein [Roseobacteraceae bacterium S113]